MSVTVVKRAPKPPVLKTIDCRFCGATLEYMPADVKRQDGHDWGGGPDGQEWIDCPDCKRPVIIRSW